MVQVGKPAPDFRMQGVNDAGEFKEYALQQFKGQWVVLFFYPLDFTFICPTEITGFSKALGEFDKLNAKILGVSTDSVHSHKAWLKDLGKLGFPLLSDMSHKASRDYGVLIEEEGHTVRGTFIIDPEGKLMYALTHDKGIGRSIKETLRVLAALQQGELCPVDWEPGKETLHKQK